MMLSAAASANAGTKGFQFLKIQSEARGSALGGSLNSLAAGTAALYWNPAGIVQTDGNQLRLDYNRWLGSMNYFSAAYTRSLGQGAFGGGFYFMDQGTLESDGYSEALSKNRVFDLRLSAAYAYQLGIINMGGTFHFVRSQVFEDSAAGAAFDVGVQIMTESSFSAGLNLRNLGFVSAMGSAKEGVPMIVSAGLGYAILNTESLVLNVLANADFFLDDKPDMSAAAEVLIKNMIALRVGYKLDLAAVNTAGWSRGLTIGAGLQLDKFNLDFAFLSYSELGSSFQLGIALDFK